MQFWTRELAPLSLATLGLPFVHGAVVDRRLTEDKGIAPFANRTDTYLTLRHADRCVVIDTAPSGTPALALATCQSLTGIQPFTHRGHKLHPFGSWCLGAQATVAGATVVLVDCTTPLALNFVRNAQGELSTAAGSLCLSCNGVALSLAACDAAQSAVTAARVSVITPSAPSTAPLAADVTPTRDAATIPPLPTTVAAAPAVSTRTLTFTGLPAAPNEGAATAATTVYVTVTVTVTQTVTATAFTPATLAEDASLTASTASTPSDAPVAAAPTLPSEVQSAVTPMATLTVQPALPALVPAGASLQGNATATIGRTVTALQTTPFALFSTSALMASTATSPFVPTSPIASTTFIAPLPTSKSRSLSGPDRSSVSTNFASVTTLAPVVAQASSATQATPSAAVFNPTCPGLSAWPVASAQFEAEVLRLVNVQRSRGATCGTTAYAPTGALAVDSGITCVARAFAQDMDQYNYFSHTDRAGNSPFTRLSNAGIGWSAAAENIAKGQSTPSQVVADWVGSAGHCADLMGGYTLTGVGFVDNVWVQDFTRP